MRIGMPLSHQRIAPLFETAETFMLISPGNSDREPTTREIWRMRIDEKCQQLVCEGSHVLLCGALSRHWQDYLRQLGIEVYAFLAGDADEILRSYLQDGKRGLERYAMPGYAHRGVRRRRLRRGHLGENLQFHKE